MKQMIRIDMTDKSFKIGAIPKELSQFGGRSLTSRLVSKLIPPNSHPLGKFNKLIFSPGLLSGTNLSSSNRLSAGSKSPLTHGIKESNSGGMAALRLAQNDIATLIVEGLQQDGDNWDGIVVSTNEDGSTAVSFIDLTHLKGALTQETADYLYEHYGKNISCLVIGPAGEMKLCAASIHINDKEGETCRTLGRGGLGAVMGSKRIKAIIIAEKPKQFLKPVTIEQNAFIKDITKRILDNPTTGIIFPRYGTASTLLRVNKLKGLPTKNYSRGIFPDAHKISGEYIYDLLNERKNGNPTHGCMPGCIIRCSNKFVDVEGTPVVGSLEYETICLLGSNLEISDIDAIARFNKICNEIGVDTIEVGGALGVAAEAGVLEFGDIDAVTNLLNEIGKGTAIGRLLASGSETVGRVYGVTRVASVKGQNMAAYDPRAIKGLGVTYATTAMGADHTAGNVISADVDHEDSKGKIELSKTFQTSTIIADSLGFCVFAMRIMSNPELLEQAISLFSGNHITYSELIQKCEETIRIEKTYNMHAGLNKYHDKLPEFMYEEPLEEDGRVYDISPEELNSVYY